MIYEMIMKKNPVSVPEYWATLLVKLEDELNMGWSIVSPTPEKLDERQKVLKQIVDLVHKTVVEAENARG